MFASPSGAGALAALAAACLALALARAHQPDPDPADAQRRGCVAITTIAEGKTDTEPHHLPPIILAPGESHLNHQIPSARVCGGRLGRTSVGVVVSVCDSDVAPEVRVDSLRQAHVRRRGALLSSAVVNIAVYCGPCRRQGDEDVTSENDDVTSEDDDVTSEDDDVTSEDDDVTSEDDVASDKDSASDEDLNEDADREESCSAVTTAVKGIIKYEPHDLPSIYIRVGQAELTYNIPSVAVCRAQGRHPIGVAVTVCEARLAAAAWLPSLHELRVVRRPRALRGGARVHVRVYCSGLAERQRRDAPRVAVGAHAHAHAHALAH